MSPFTLGMGCLLFMTAAVAALQHQNPSHSSVRAQRKFWGFNKAVEYKKATLRQALAYNDLTSATVVVCGQDKPVRHQPGTTPVLSFAPAAAAVVPLPVQHAVQQAMQQVLLMCPRCQYALEVDVLPQRQTPAHPTTGGNWPLAVFDVSTGKVLLSQQVLGVLQATPVQVASAVSQACVSSWQHLLAAANNVLPPSLSALLSFVPRAVSLGLAASYAAAPPKWFCFVCPIVLGLLAPLIINAGVGEAADMACKSLDLSDEECVQLWFTALALGMILSLLSAIPIYKVCRLYECAHPGPNGTTTAA